MKAIVATLVALVAAAALPTSNQEYQALAAPLAYEMSLGRFVPKPVRPVIRIKQQAKQVRLSQVRGRASWYCKAGVSACHYKYPPGSMVAAACGKLRTAMGPGWRGKVVTVINRTTRAKVTVRLVDQCGSKIKLIDLYWEPMSRLGGTGVLPVTVQW